MRSTSKSGNDKLIAEIITNDEQKATDNIQFSLSTGATLIVEPITGATITDPNATNNEANKYQLTLPSLFDETELKAFYKYKNEEGKEFTKQCGKVNLIPFDAISNQVVIVPVNGTNLDFDETALQDSLNKIYKTANTTWTVNYKNNLRISGFDEENVDAGTTNMLSCYTDDMKTIINEYDKEEGIDNTKYYLFIVGKAAAPNHGKLGQMPLKRRFGFIFYDELKQYSQKAQIKTIAHELAHGPFRLRHTFSSENDYTLDSASTANLMDYTLTGTNPTQIPVGLYS